VQKYSVNDYTVESILGWIRSDEIAIPEIQRPFVWSSTQVRDLMDSLYQGYPVGYIISWRNPDIRLRNGSIALGRKILIDGQQRVTALSTALNGHPVIDENYNKIVIKIAFHPLEERFEVLNPAIEKDKAWIPDISKVMHPEFSILAFIRDYQNKNPDVEETILENVIQRLKTIVLRPIGLIELNHDLDIDTVTEIFIRINSKGVVLSQSDFVMSKIASNEAYEGNVLRKAIDYFCHLSVKPEFYSHIIEHDHNFVKTEYFEKMKWLKNEKSDLYDPDYSDLIRVAFCYKFKRGKLSDLVSLLSGRNFETRTFEESIAEKAFADLKDSALTFMNETLYKRFLMIIESAGFISSKIIRSQNVLNFAYALLLHLKDLKMDHALIEHYVRKWFVMSMLTGRYSGSAESSFDKDVKTINETGIAKTLSDIEEAELSNSYWDSGLVQRFNTQSVNTPVLHVYWAAQVKARDNGFLSKDTAFESLFAHRGDIHHIFPKQYLKDNGLMQSQYNQIANYVYVQQEINLKVGKKSPSEYMQEIKDHCDHGKALYGSIKCPKELIKNLESNCIPENIFTMTIDNYYDFLEQRRKLMAQKVKLYYESL